MKTNKTLTLLWQKTDFNLTSNLKRNILIFVVLSVILIPKILYGQLPNPPGVEWKKADWYPVHPVNGAQKQDESGEDWWYSHIQSYDFDNNNEPNGFACAGFSSFVNYALDESGTDGCAYLPMNPSMTWDCNELEFQNYVQGVDFATLALISQRGREVIWMKHFVQGEFFHVIQTSDGGYLGVGFTVATRTLTGGNLIYNPGQNGCYANYFDVNDVVTCNDCNINAGHILLVKTDDMGELEWQYIYGMYPMCDVGGDYFAYLAENAYQNGAAGFDVIETDNNHFRIVGEADADPDYPTNHPPTMYQAGNAFMIDVNIDGMFQWGEFYDFSGQGGNTVESSRANKITKYTDGVDECFIMAGFYTAGTTALPVTDTRVFCKKFDNTVAPAPIWTSTLGNPSSNHNATCYDVEVTSHYNVGNDDKIILLPIVDNCNNCLYASDNMGEGFIYGLDGMDGTPAMTPIDISNSGLSPIHAYDLRVGICNTDDGGFAVVSSKQPNTPPAPYSCVSGSNGSTASAAINTGYWGTDAYVAKFNSSFAMEWEKTFDEDEDAPEAFPADLKKQECLYDITETEEGGLVISGNYSANFDDSYLVKLYTNCNNTLTFDLDGAGSIIQASTLPGYPDLTAGTYLVRGSIHVENGDVLTIGSGVILKFADSYRCGEETNIVVEIGGHLIFEGDALLTSLYDECPGSMWDGIEVRGDPNSSTQNIYNDGFFEMFDDATIENARMGTLAGESGYNDNGIKNPTEAGGGGIITINGGHFINCRRYVHFAPHTKAVAKYNLSTISNCEFLCNGPLVDPAYQMADGTPIGVNAFITINQARRIVIDNNTFTDSYNFPALQRGYGIITHEAGGEFTNNHFYDLTRGIEAQYYSAVTKPVIIDNNEIDNTQIGIFIAGGGWHSVTNNDITNIPDGSIGMLLLGSNGFSVSDNNFSASGPSYNYGVIVNSSEQGGGTIGRNNTYTGLYTGSQTELNNDLLRIRCNDYTDNEMGWYISPQFPGTLGSQGTGCDPNVNAEQRAGNTFSNSSSYDIVSSATFHYWAWGNSGTVPTSSGSGIMHDCSPQIGLDNSCSVQKNSLGIEELHEGWLAEGEPVEKLDYFNALVQKTIELDSNVYDTLTFDLLKEALDNDMDSSYIIKQLVMGYYFYDSLTQATDWLEYLTEENDENFVTLYDNLIDAKNGELSLGELEGDDHLLHIREISVQTGQTAIAAKTILNYYYDEDYYYTPETYNPSPRLSTFDSKQIQQNLTVVPNPSSDLITLKLNGKGFNSSAIVYLTDIFGKKTKIAISSNENGSGAFSISNFKNGIYFINYIIDEEGENLTAKFVVLK